ncbi:hypothetical protein IWT140_00151 [Secundilactobacillus pentosiphilus]|uniref:Integral membrane protein n=1 Tax=Secundilactobacillus pentosiphilus TaxID=1714682 RepID=A0A1Z5ILB3_9LACO|nr:LasU family protein [Secundilactobacillus pentosiphilus]GAX02554.1 hypothetical protein IWT140_00151 [Secundilactobacillus pentosiphilus]
MKKVWIASPTFILLAMVLVGAVATGISPHLRNNLLGFGAMGLIGYSFVAVFVYGIALSAHGQPNKLSEMPLGRKLLLSYLTAIWAITMAVVIFLMAQN